MSMFQHSNQLGSKKEKFTLEEHGFTILESVFSEDTLSKIRYLTDRIISYGEKELKDPFQKYYVKHRVDQGVLYDLFQRHPDFQDLAKAPAILKELANNLGSDIFLYENSLVYKPKGKDNTVPWHQDFINRPDEPRKFIAWIALDNVTKENGAMKLIPGSHKLGFLPCYTVPGETHHTRACLDGIDLSNFIYGEINAGDVLIFNQLLVHSSDRVETVMPRRAYRVAYQGFDQIFTPRATPIVLMGGDPESLAQKYPQKQELEEKANQKTLIQRFVHKLARILLSI